MKYIKTFESFIFEVRQQSVKSLEKELKKLNKEYVMLDKQMDQLSRAGQDTEELSDRLDAIERRMTEIGAELESRESLDEQIRAEEAHRDETAIQTVIDGKRGMGFITLVGATIDRELFWTLVKEHGLKTMRVPSNPFEGYIYYRKTSERQARELLEIAERYEGFLAYNATKEDTRRIGQLLGYVKRDIDKYIQERY